MMRSPEAATPVCVCGVSAQDRRIGFLADTVQRRWAWVGGAGAAGALEAAVSCCLPSDGCQRGQTAQRGYWRVGSTRLGPVQIVVGGGTKQGAWWGQSASYCHAPAVCVGRRFPERHWEGNTQISLRVDQQTEHTVWQKVTQRKQSLMWKKHIYQERVGWTAQQQKAYYAHRSFAGHCTDMKYNIIKKNPLHAACWRR